MIEPRLSPRQARAARNGKFDDKLAVLVALGTISDQEQRFGSVCHEYRNEVYHAGVRHEELIGAIGWAYYRWCCDLFRRLPPMMYLIGGHRPPTPRARNIIERAKVDHGVHFVPNVEQLAPYLLGLCPQTPPLGPKLSALAEEAIEAVHDSIGFIQRDAPQRMSVAQIVEDSQLEWEVDQRLEREHLDGTILGRDTERWNRRNDVVREVMDNFEPKHRSVPLSSWRRRAASLAAEPNDIVALNRYQDLRDSMAYLEGAVRDLAMKLDHWIQNQIDIARGK
jgi:hypothetical protein